MRFRVEQILPAVMMVLCVGSSITYLCYGNHRLAIHWAARAVLFASVTF